MNWKKRVTSLLLAVCLVVGMFPAMSSAVGTEKPNMQAQAAGLPFTDVPQKEWYYEAVKYVYESNLMVGMSDTKFEPNKPMTRAMVAQILYSKEGRPAVSGEPAFRDVPKSEWYYNAVQWASQNGVAHGMGDGTFKPNSYVNREEFAQFMYGYAGSPTVSGTLSFPDAKKVSSWAVNAMLWATENKLINGNLMPDGRKLLEPQGRTTRAQAAIILKGLCENISTVVEGYSITDLIVNGQQVTVEVSAPRACTVSVKFLNEKTEAELKTTAKADVSAGSERTAITATITGNLLPTHYIAVAYLLDSSGKPLCNKFTSMKYTTAQEKFDKQTVDDFPQKTVLNFDEDKTENFGVLTDTVKKPAHSTKKNVITVNANDTYTVTNIDSTVKALKQGDEALFYDKNNEPVLVSVGTIKISGTTATITPNHDVTLDEYYEVLKIDMDVDADVEHIDLSEADEGVELLSEKKTGSESVRSEQQSASGEFGHSEKQDLSGEFKNSVEMGLKYETKHFKGEGKIGLSEKIEIEFEYDVRLFAEDYMYCKIESKTKCEFNLSAKGKFDNDEAVKDKREQTEVKLGRIPVPLGAGFSCSLSVTLPIEVGVEGGVTFKASCAVTSGFTYSTPDGCHNLEEKTVTVSDLHAEGKFEAKVGPKVAISVEFLNDVLKGEISAQVGADFTATVKTGSAGTNNDTSIHVCALCLDGDLYLFANGKMKLSYKITEHLKGTPINITVAEGKIHLFEFYVSLINESESPFKGQVTVGKGKCINKKYRIAISVLNSEDNEVTGTEVTVTRNGGSTQTVKSGEKLYLYDGEYTAECKLGEEVIQKKFTVKGKAKSVTLRPDIKEDPDPVDPNDPNDPIPVDPADIIDSGKCGDNLTWVLETNKTLYITGTGDMYEQQLADKSPWDAYYSEIEKVVIKNGVTSIGSYAFYRGGLLTSVTIPNSVTRIGEAAFMNCSSLPSITIPNSVTRIGEAAFMYCSNLTSVTIPNSVTTIEDDTFSDCTALASVEIPDSVTSIGNGAFSGCTVLTNVEIPNSVTSMGEYVFEDCASLIHVKLSENLTELPRWTFASCSSLPSMTIPNGVTSIGKEAFSNCTALQNVTIPNSVTDIGDFAFFDCYELQNATIPNGVKRIGDFAFDSCYKLRSATIPNGVTYLGGFVFVDCHALTSVTIPDSVTSLGDGSFMGCTSLTDVAISDSVTSFGNRVFSGCTLLTSVRIPDGVEWIESGTFQDCTSLTSVTIPSNIKIIYDDAFNHCTKLTDIYYRGSQSQWDIISIFPKGNDPLTNATIHYNS